MTRYHVSGALLAAILLAPTVSAATTFNNQATFLAATSPSHFESFESFAPLDTDLSVLNLPDFSITDLNAATDDLIVEDTNFDVHATHGTNYVYWFVFSFGGGVRFNFSQPINAFGFTLTDPIDQGPSTISYATDGGDAGTVLTGSLPDSSEAFWGIQSDTPMTFAELTISHSTDFDAVGIDEVYFNVVPEPAGVALVLGIAVTVSPRSLRRRRA